MAALVAVLAIGCGGGSRSTARGPVINVTVRDFKLSAPSQLPAGPVTLRVHNLGPDDHEVIVVRTQGSLPFRADGITLDEDRFHSRIVAALEPLEPGSVTDLHAHLTPGSYELFCNMSGHYLGGMHVEATVR